VRVRAGAFGPATPRRDLFLSPDHAVYVDDVLIPVKYLVNGHSIVQLPVSSITYYHLELPRHNVVLAEGLAAESYLDAGDRANFANNSLMRLYPDFSPRVPDACALREACACAPIIVTGPKLAAARRRLSPCADRAAA